MMAESDDLTYAKKKLNQARIEDGGTCPIYQSLSLSKTQDDICLLQLNSDVMHELEIGNTLIIRGEVDEPAVICTKDKTFELKEAETSNSLLLTPGLLWPEECVDGEERVIHNSVSGIFHTYYEMRLMKPSFKKLRTLLETSSYKGNAYEDDADSITKFTFKDLLDIIQCSEDELKSELIEMQTCVIDGYVRILDFGYKYYVATEILKVVESQSIPLDKIPKESTLQILEDLIPKDILEACFSWFCQEIEAVDDETGCKLYALKELPVCVLYAEVMLRSSGKFDLKEFLSSWQKSVPEGMICSLEQLRGIALVDTMSKPETISYFPYHNLPENVSERFEYLFRIREKWSFDDIVPFLEDRASATANVKSLLIKYTRESTKNGVKFYSSKW